MNIKINSVKFSPTKELEDFVQTKVSKLGQYSDEIIGAEVFLKLENTQDLENKIAEIKVDIPGNELFVKKQTKSFEESTDTAIEALKRQITKAKEKRRGQ
ncbi:MAG: ribosome-associated translation inhibitor RaiA [Bacteroidales bacterium]|nr:ribosome-associated translation inhibitor RaiA [Bacteroidales bacterium]MBN2817919.1 ribosome-associated translation inhibitor RaiA [Bacteroidales bacterium]